MSILRYRHLSWRDKAMLGRAMWPMLRMGDRGRRRLDGGLVRGLAAGTGAVGCG